MKIDEFELEEVGEMCGVDISSVKIEKEGDDIYLRGNLNLNLDLELDIKVIRLFFEKVNELDPSIIIDLEDVCMLGGNVILKLDLEK